MGSLLGVSESAGSLSSAFVHQALLLRPMHSNYSGVGLNFRLFLSLFFQFLDKTFADAIETCQETTPQMLVTPEIVSCLAANHRQVCVSCGRLLVVIRCGVFSDATVVNSACLTTREDDVAALVGVGGEKNN